MTTSHEEKMGRIEAGQEFFKEALTRMEQGQRKLADRVDQVAGELHTAAIALTRCADRLDRGAEIMKDANDTLDSHGVRISSLETTRTRQAAFISAAGIAGGVAGWMLDHFWKMLAR